MTAPSLTAPLAAFKRVIEEGLKEDAADRDATSMLLPPDARASADIVTRDPIIAAGVRGLEFFGGGLNYRLDCADGDEVSEGRIIARIDGPARELLARERTMLNLLARLCGIATLTKRFVREIAEGSRVKILDTRKTTPGLRELEKYAVRCGGGTNHRFSLADAIFIKDNHLAIRPVQYYREILAERGRGDLPLIVEADSRESAMRALDLNPDRILLDNMSDREIEELIPALRGAARSKVEIEVSGGIKIERIGSLSRFDIDFISVGAMIHSALSANLSLEARRD